MKFLLQVEQFDVIRNALMDMVAKFAQTVPNAFMALIIFIIGYIIAKIVAKIVGKTLKKVGVDKIGEKLNEIDIVEKANMDIKISDLASKFLYYFILLFFTVASTSVLGIPEISNLITDIFTFIPNLLVAIIILILGTLLAICLER